MFCVTVIVEAGSTRPPDTRAVKTFVERRGRMQYAPTNADEILCEHAERLGTVPYDTQINKSKRQGRDFHILAFFPILFQGRADTRSAPTVVDEQVVQFGGTSGMPSPTIAGKYACSLLSFRRRSCPLSFRGRFRPPVIPRAVFARGILPLGTRFLPHLSF
jgi:hypothetical protein